MGRACGKKLCLVGGHLYLTTPGERCSVHFLFVIAELAWKLFLRAITTFFGVKGDVDRRVGT